MIKYLRQTKDPRVEVLRQQRAVRNFLISMYFVKSKSPKFTEDEE